MTRAELDQLQPYFIDGERYWNGTPVNWEEVCFETMQGVWQVRDWLKSPCRLIRGPHPGKPTAVDAAMPGVSQRLVMLALIRLGGPYSWGVYSGPGHNFHIDTRPKEPGALWPARWLAIREREEGILAQFGFYHLIAYRNNGWSYLKWNHPDALEAAVLVCRLSDGELAPMEGAG